MTATITYTNHYGEVKTRVVEGTDFYFRGTNLVGVDATGIAVADGNQLVTCEVKNEDGEVVAWAKDSIVGYCVRNENADQGTGLNTNLMKFVASAYKFFHH